MMRRSGWVGLLLLGGACGGDGEGLLLKLNPSKPAFLAYAAASTANARRITTSAEKELALAADETVMIGTCGLTGSTYSGDTVLRLFSPDAIQVAYNDDACEYHGSRIDYTAPTAGTYRLRAGCADQGACEGTLAVSRRKARIPFSGLSNTDDGRVHTFDTPHVFHAGDTVRVSTCGFSAYGANARGDTWLRLFHKTKDGLTEVASNDDGRAFGCGAAAELLYAVPTTGTYEVHVGCARAGACAGTLVIYAE
jgi:hypothetical protein